MGRSKSVKLLFMFMTAVILRQVLLVRQDKAVVLSENNKLPVPDNSTNLADPQIIISMTTIPSRIKYIEPTLISIIHNQTMSHDKFFLTLPLKSWRTQSPVTYDIPDFLKPYQDKGMVTVLRPEYDYGPVGKMLYALKETISKDSRIIYIDDDVDYDSNLVRNLVHKSIEYPNAAVAFSGCKLRNNFRQVSHWSKAGDRHPNLFFPVSGTKTFDGETKVEIVQGFTGVLIRPSFFDFDELLRLVVQTATEGSTVWKSDDVILSAYMEHRNVTRMLVDGGTFPVLNRKAASTNRLSEFMNLHIVEAVYFLQQRLGIWRDYKFLNIDELSDEVIDLMKCEAVNKQCDAKLTKDDAAKKLEEILSVQ